MKKDELQDFTSMLIKANCPAEVVARILALKKGDKIFFKDVIIELNSYLTAIGVEDDTLRRFFSKNQYNEAFINVCQVLLGKVEKTNPIDFLISTYQAVDERLCNSLKTLKNEGFSFEDVQKIITHITSREMSSQSMAEISERLKNKNLSLINNKLYKITG